MEELTPEERFQRIVAELKPEDRERLQKVLAELGEHQITADLLNQQITILAASLSELSMTMETIKTVKGAKPDTEILVPIGSDSFVTAKLPPTDKVITGLGAGVAAERSIPSALETLEARVAEVGQAIERARKELEKLGKRVEALGPEVERILAKARKK
jgi:prefoldin alpha subunit